MEQQRRGDVVGQVADDAQGVAEAAEIEFEGVAFMDGELLRREVPAQPGDQVAVDLDDVQASHDRAQRLGQRAETGADLDDMVIRLGGDRRDDLAHDAGRYEEILPKPLARPMCRKRSLHRRAMISAATFTAAKRLAGSARPVPARSSAVP